MVSLYHHVKSANFVWWGAEHLLGCDKAFPLQGPCARNRLLAVSCGRKVVKNQVVALQRVQEK